MTTPLRQAQDRLGPAHEVADRDVRGYLGEHVDVIARKHAVDDRHAHFGTDLSDHLANPQMHVAMQHLEPIFSCAELRFGAQRDDSDDEMLCDNRCYSP